jgi:hypothetical protein
LRTKDNSLTQGQARRLQGTASTHNETTTADPSKKAATRMKPWLIETKARHPSHKGPFLQKGSRRIQQHAFQRHIAGMPKTSSHVQDQNNKQSPKKTKPTFRPSTAAGS